MSNNHDHICYCGTADYAPHEIGESGCVRSMTNAPKLTSDPKLPWLVDRVKVTDRTLRQQRGYSQHQCGCWSRWPDSVNSL